MPKIKEMTNDELIAEAKSMESMIYDVECYSVNDLRYLFQLNEEMRQRDILVIEEVF